MFAALFGAVGEFGDGDGLAEVVNDVLEDVGALLGGECGGGVLDEDGRVAEVVGFAERAFDADVEGEAGEVEGVDAAFVEDFREV